MIIKITLEFDNAEAAAEFLTQTAPATNTDMPVPVKTKRTRRTKAEMAADATEMGTGAPAAVAAAAPDLAIAPPTAAPTAPQVGTPLSIDDVRAALHKVSETKGLEKCKELLVQFQVDRVSAIQPEQFQAFVDACAAAL